MHQNDRGIKQGDRLLKMQGKLDRGPVEFKSHIAEQEGEIMAIATRDVISVPPTQSIIAAVEQMTKCGFRRLPGYRCRHRKTAGDHHLGRYDQFHGRGGQVQTRPGQARRQPDRGGQRERPHDHDPAARDALPRRPDQRCGRRDCRKEDRRASRSSTRTASSRGS